MNSSNLANSIWRESISGTSSGILSRDIDWDTDWEIDGILAVDFLEKNPLNLEMLLPYTD